MSRGKLPLEGLGYLLVAMLLSWGIGFVHGCWWHMYAPAMGGR